MKEAGFEAYFVGGSVRDFVRGVAPGDFDIVTSGLPDQVASLFERTVAVGAQFGVMVVMADGHPYEVATFRSDDVYEDGRRPTRVHFSSAREDVFRRDFTINGLLMDPEINRVIDYVDGLADIGKKIVRTIGDPAVRFNEDFLRMLRAVRFAANLDFHLDAETQNAIAAHAANIRNVSAERIQEELGKILTRGGARRGFELLSASGLLKHILPEVDRMHGVSQPPRFHPEGDVWEHTMIMLDTLARETAPNTDPALAWSALLHDVGKPVSRSEDEKGVHFYGHVQQGESIAGGVLHRLKFSNARRETVLSLIHHHMDFMNVQKMRPARLKRFLRMPDFRLHLELHRLDCLASHGMLDYYEFCLAQLQIMDHQDLHPPRLVTGHDLLAMGFTEGKRIGEILQALEEEQLENRIRDHSEAVAFIRDRWKLSPRTR
ncbi:MAG: CCA tRNA nucleotidyltransferase [Deltaproteobacteria bacterium]|nr:CCA tRNA nucleotidyltransferase [Deltaproteobacteria bacterium]